MSAPSELFESIRKKSDLKKTETKSKDFALERAKLEAGIKAGKSLDEIKVSDEVKQAYKEEKALGVH
jgi:hypothetical protein